MIKVTNEKFNKKLENIILDWVMCNISYDERYRNKILDINKFTKTNKDELLFIYIF